MKNFNQIAMGLMIGAMAIGFSAFTGSPSGTVKPGKAVKAGMISDNFIVQLNAANNFVELSSANPANCGDPATRECVYDVTSSGKSNIPDQSAYTATQIDTYVSNGWLTPDSDSSLALYQP